MKGKLLGIGIVGFWVTMMVALVRLEYGTEVSALDEVPVERVLRKVLSQPDPLRLNLYYLGQTVGVLRADIVPIAIPNTNMLNVTESRLQAYRVQTELNLDLTLGNWPVKLRAGSDSVVSRQLELQRLNLRGTLNGSRFRFRAASTNGQMALSYDLGDGNGQQDLRLDGWSGTGLVRSLGLPAGLLPSGEARSDAAANTKAYFGRLNLGGIFQRAYLIETRINEALWARLWVDEGGQLLRAESSAGITARSDLLEADLNRQPPDHHDPH